MGIPVLKESWCGCSVKTGSKIISWFQVIYSGLVLLLLSLFEVILVDIASADECNGEINCTNDIYQDSTKTDENNIKNLFGLLAAFVGFYLVEQVVLFVVGIVNLFGIYKEKPNLMVPYLITSTISLIASTVILIYEAIAYGITLSTVVSVFGIGFDIYFLLIVYSYFRELKSNGNGTDLGLLI